MSRMQYSWRSNVYPRRERSRIQGSSFFLLDPELHRVQLHPERPRNVNNLYGIIKDAYQQTITHLTVFRRESVALATPGTAFSSQ
jgi:hypothetical protein